MSICRPMNEYESALSSAVATLIKTVISLGADRAILASQFRESAREAKLDGRESEAAVIDFLANLAERDGAYVPSPPISVIAGGKDDLSD